MRFSRITKLTFTMLITTDEIVFKRNVEYDNDGKPYIVEEQFTLTDWMIAVERKIGGIDLR